MKNADLGGHMKIKKLAAVCLAGTLAVSALGGCGINKDEVVATYDSREVTLGIVNFMCRYQQSYYDEAYRGYFGDDVWQQDLSGSGASLQEDVKSDVMDSLHEMYTLQDHMDEYGIGISDEDKEAIRTAAAAYMAANASDTLKAMGATQEIVEEALTLYTIQSRMYDAIIALADTDVSDEEANMRGYTYVRASLSGYYDSEYNYVSYTDDELAELKDTFDSMAEAVAEDPESFETVTELAGYTATTDAYNADSGLDESVIEALDALGEGEVSGAIETDNYLYLVRLDSETDEDATEQNREDLIEERQSDFYTDTVTGWQEDDGWTIKEKVLAKIKFDSAFKQAEDTETEAVTEE
jgi:foldase protein PrsA